MKTSISCILDLDKGDGSGKGTVFTGIIDHKDDFEFNTKLQEAILKKYPGYKIKSLKITFKKTM